MKSISKIRLHGSETVYPFASMLVVLMLILVSPFVSLHLNWIAFLICIIRMMAHDEKVFATDYCILMPLTQTFCTAGGMSLLVWLCLVAAVWYFIRGKVKRNSALVLILLLLNYLLLRMQMDINRFVLSFGQMFVLYVLLQKQDTESAVRSALYFCWSLVITSVYALIFRNTSQIIALRGPETPAIWGTTIMRFSGLIRDPNYYTTLLLMGLAVLCKLKETDRLHSAGFWGLALAMTAFGILTYSKTFFLVFLLLGGIYIVWQFWRRKVIKGVFFASVAIIAGIYLLFSDSSPFAVVMQRLTGGNDLSAITTHRSDLFVAYWDAITENWHTFFFGRGLGAPLLADRGAHNLYLEITYYIGVAGLVLVLIFYISMMKWVQRSVPDVNHQSKIAKYAVPVIVIVQYFALQGMFLLITYSAWFMAFLSIYITEKSESK